MQTTSLSLLDRLAAAGDNSDWQRLIQIYRPFVEQVARGYPELASQADDVAQDVMMVLMRELPVFKRQRAGSFRTWLRIITVNQLRIAARKSKKFRQASKDGANLESQIEELSDPASLCAQKWDAEHDQIVFRRAMEIVSREIKPLTWQAFQLYALEDQSPADVAEQLGISLNSVLLAKSRTLRRLRDEVAGLVDDV